ncbi:MAG: ABC transporter ATP-binding protein [Thermodesulfobacteriota bacterium]
MSKSAIVEVVDLHKNYSNVKAVNGISFEVYEGEIFGITGPNGAGKTSLIECIEGLKRFDKGSIRVMGLDPQKDKSKLRKLIGIQLQESRLPSRIKVWEALDLFASFYASSADWRSILKDLGLREKGDSYYETLSGGQKQRLSIALSLISTPRILFFDELTTGLDPQARRVMWDMVRKIRNQERSVILVTHFMDEAETLCDRVAIINKGKLIALDKPTNLVQNSHLPIRIKFSTETNIEKSGILSQIQSTARVSQNDNEVLALIHCEADLFHIIQILITSKVCFRDISIKKPTLEDVYLKSINSDLDV